MFTADALRAEGFTGFVPLFSLDVERDEVPGKPGVYVVLRESTESPTFLAESPAGVRKGRKVPTVEKLASKWVDNCAVVYVGMTTRPLAARLDEFREMGFGGKNHYGGRNVLQLADRADLLVCWRETAKADAEDIEWEMLEQFVTQFGRLPFANGKRGRKPLT